MMLTKRLAHLAIFFSLSMFGSSSHMHGAVSSSALLSLMMMQTGAPIFSANPASINFGPSAVGVTTPVFNAPPPFAQPLQISNTGNASMTANFSFSSTEFSFDSATNIVNPVTISAGSSVTGGLAFKPSAVGVRTGQFISTDNATGSPHAIALTGTGITIASNDFGVVLDPSLPSTVPLTAGQTTTFNMWVLTGPGLNASPSVAGETSCSGGPTGSTCTVAPQVFLGGFSQTSSRNMITVTVNVPAGTAAVRHDLELFWGLGILTLACLTFRRRRVVTRLAFCGALLLTVLVLSCGGSNGTTTGSASPLMITVAADGLGITHTTTVPVSVQ